MNYLFRVRKPVVEGLEEEAAGPARGQGSHLDHTPPWMPGCSEKPGKSKVVTESKHLNTFRGSGLHRGSGHHSGSGDHSDQSPILVDVTVITEAKISKAIDILNVEYSNYHWTVLVRVRQHTKLQNNQRICRLIIRTNSEDYRK